MAVTPQPAGNDGQEALILQSVDRFLEREVRPVVRALDAADTYPAEMVEKIRTLGLFGATISPDHGGLGLSAVTYAKDRKSTRLNSSHRL